MRQNVVEADEILGVYFPVLDNGFIALVDYMGNDQSIVDAARTSYAKGTKTVSDNRGLIRRLMRDRHTSPFEFVELKFHVRAPLYVIQQWLRHRTSNFCQESHRFSEIKDDFQKTKPDAWRLQNKDNKQGSDGFLRTRREKGQDYEDYWDGQELCGEEKTLHNLLRNTYNRRINAGIAREQARKDIPHSTYSSIYIKSDLHNLLHFLRLRTAPDAQLEIREYANLIAGMTKRVCPITFEAWIDYAYTSTNFTRLDMEFMYFLISEYSESSIGDWQGVYELDCECFIDKIHEKIGMSTREYKEFWGKLKRKDIPNFDLDLSKAIKSE
jgi:thymidylate synthase (FAD)